MSNMLNPAILVPTFQNLLADGNGQIECNYYKQNNHFSENLHNQKMKKPMEDVENIENLANKRLKLEQNPVGECYIHGVQQNNCSPGK